MFNNAKLKSLLINNNQDREKAVDDWLVCVAIKYRKAQSRIYYWFYCNIFNNSLKYSIFFGYLRQSGISYFCRLSQATDLLHCPLESIFHVRLFTYFSGVKTPFSMIQDPFSCFKLVYFAIIIGLIISYALLRRVRSLLFISVQNLNHSLWHHRLRRQSGVSFVHSNSP